MYISAEGEHLNTLTDITTKYIGQRHDICPFQIPRIDLRFSIG